MSLTYGPKKLDISVSNANQVTVKTWPDGVDAALYAPISVLPDGSITFTVASQGTYAITVKDVSNQVVIVDTVYLTNIATYDITDPRSFTSNTTQSNYIPALVAYGQGFDPTGQKSSAQAFQNLVTAAGSGSFVKRVFIPAGTTLKIDATINAASGVTIDGAGSSSKIDIGNLAILFNVDATTPDFAVQNISVTGVANTTGRIVAGASVNNLTIQNVTTLNTSLINLGASTSYANAGVTVPNSTNVVVRNCRCSTNGTSNSAAIAIRYTDNVVISNNIIDGFKHGAQWWGGDSNTAVDGAVANARKCSNYVISNNVITNIAMGGIWGSMGRNMSITGNVVRNCGDVGIDLEGTLDSIVSGNTVSDCANGCLTTFFYNRSITFTGNTVTTTTDNQFLFAIYNSNLSISNKDINVVGNTFLGLGVMGVVGKDPVENIRFSGNLLRNTRFSLPNSNSRYTVVENNTFLYDIVAAAAFNAILVSRNTSTGRARVATNTIISNSAQPSGSRGIYVLQDDFNSAATSVVDGNEIRNFPIDIEVNANSGNSGITPRFFIRNNILGSSTFIRTEGSTQKSACILDGNRTGTNVPYPGALPGASSTQKWDTGQRIVSATPAVGAAPAWVCTAGGTPGTWAAEANLASVTLT